MKIVDLSSRAGIVEEMDRPDSPEDQLHRTLTQFQLVNRIVSRYRSVLTGSVLQDMAKDSSRSYRLADLGAGGCDIARWLIRRCRERGLRLTICAVEHDPRVARHARAANAGYSEIEVLEADVLDGALWKGVDYIFQLAASPFFRHSFVIRDGLASIRRGFTIPEVRALVRAATPLYPVAICPYLPNRFVIRGGTTAGVHPVAQGPSAVK